MNILSATDLEKYLNEYSVYLDFWDAEQGDSHEMLGSREILEKNLDRLTKKQIDRITSLDDKAKSTLDSYQGNQTWDVEMLRQTVAITHHEYKQAA